MRIRNNFVWLTVSEDKAIDIFFNGIFDLYILYDDGNESLITNANEIRRANTNGFEIGIEVGILSK